MQRVAFWALAQRQQGWQSSSAAAAASAAWRQAARGFAIGTDTGADTHDDFKPKYAEKPLGAGADVNATIKDDITKNRVFIYMKGTPDAPMCGFSNMACRVLDAYGLKYGSRNVLADEAIRNGIKAFTEWPTIPQVFVKGEFVGGADVLMEMHNSGELGKLVESLGAEAAAGGKQ